MSVELKIKSKHLALEPAIIRHEERKLGRQIGWYARQGVKCYLKNDERSREMERLMHKSVSLQTHRIDDVATEARATYLARAYLAGTPYLRVEQKRWPDYEYYFVFKVLPRTLAMVRKYGSTPETRDTTMDQIVAWTQVLPNS